MPLRATTNKDAKFANLLRAVGEFGRFQQRLVALIFIPGILLGFTYAEYFVYTDQEHYCNTSWILKVGPNLSEAEQLNLTLPRTQNGSFLTCSMYLPVPWDLDSIIQLGLNHTVTCQDGWIYPNSKTRSLVNEFDLVCGKERDEENLQSISMAGFLTGSVIFGLINDMLGRYPAILTSLTGLVIFNFGTAFASSLHQYFFLRFLVFQAVMGYRISSVCLATEWLVGSHRVHAMFLQHCFMSVGVLFLMGLKYSLPHWRLLFLVGGAPMFLFIVYIWILPESPRWLMMKRKVEEAKQMLCRAASVNKRIIACNLLNKLQLPRNTETEASILDFYYNRHLRRVILTMSCVWFTVSYAYFILIFTPSDFGVARPFRQAISSIMKVPVQMCCIILLEYKGRKWSLTVTLTQATIMCGLLFLFQDKKPKSITMLMFAFGEASLTTTITVLFIYTAELLPTVLRATGLGLAILASTSGAMSFGTIMHRILFLQPMALCCILSAMALYFSFMLPETQNQPLSDSLKQFSKASLQREMAQTLEDASRRNSDATEAATAEDSACDEDEDEEEEDGHDEDDDDGGDDDVSDEAAKNTILNVQISKLDVDMSTNTALEKSGAKKAHN